MIRKCLCTCSYDPLRPVKPQDLCLRGIYSADSWRAAARQIFTVFISIDQLYPLQEVPGLREALSREGGNGVCLPIGPSLAGTLWFYIAATK